MADHLGSTITPLVETATATITPPLVTVGTTSVVAGVCGATTITVTPGAAVTSALGDWSKRDSLPRANELHRRNNYPQSVSCLVCHLPSCMILVPQ